jgi:hypothetical protein
MPGILFVSLVFSMEIAELTVDADTKMQSDSKKPFT